MALYVAICLIAALTALENVMALPGHIIGLIWGTTVGLALAHSNTGWRAIREHVYQRNETQMRGLPTWPSRQPWCVREGR
jgi:hypothetical protein